MTRLLFLVRVLACSLLVVCIAVTGALRFAFLPWNLFLAWIPYGIAGGIDRLASRVRPGNGTLLLPTAPWACPPPRASHPTIAVSFPTRAPQSA